MKTNCNHILGICEGRITDNKTGETLALIKQNILASDAEWTSKDSGIKIKWVGDKYNFCPLCGEDLGQMHPVIKVAFFGDGRHE